MSDDSIKFDESEDELVLRSGRRVYANCGILGLDPTGKAFTGYDSHLGEDFSEAERNEIASYMIALWCEWGGL